MPKFGGGKKVNVFPTYKLFGIELLGFPRTSYILPAKLESAPKELTFEAKGGEEKLIVTDNLDRSEDKFTDENGVTTGDDDEKEKWLTVKKEGDVYKVTAKPNTSNEERTGTVDFYVHNEDRSIDLVLNVPVLQKAAEYEFSVSPEDIKVAGYNKDFKGGELTQQMTIVYPNTAKGIKVRSSDESWLTVDDTWASSTVGELNTTGVRTIHIKPNFNLDTPRDGFITIELTKADGSVEPRTLKVNQSAFELKVELDPDDLMLTAQMGYNHLEDAKDTYNFGVGGRYYIVQNGLYLGAGFKYKHAENYNDFLPGVQVGYAFFISRTVTIEPELYFDISTKKFDYTCYGLSIGLGVYLFRDQSKN
jgi:hypothetical protein